MSCAIYGLQEAMSDFDSHFGDLLCGGRAIAEGLKMGMSRHTADPASWSGMGIYMAKHVDDGIVVGPMAMIQEAMIGLKRFFKLKVREALSAGSAEKLLGGMIRRTPRGFAQMCLAKHIEEFLEATGMQGASPVVSPGEKSDAKKEDEEPLSKEAALVFRRAVGIALFIGRFRSDMQYSIKECSRGMTVPTVADWRRVKRIGRYLRGTQGIEQMIETKSGKQDLIEVMCDSDWAFDKVERKSTTGVIMYWSGAFITSYSRTQSTIALSSTEAEGYALSSGGAEGLGLKSLLLEMGIDTAAVKLNLYSDSSGAISAQSRLGLGKTMKHVEIRHLFFFSN